MYRPKADYEKIAKVIIDIYADYALSSFPIDEKDVCRKLGVDLIPYSSFNENTQKQLVKYSEYGFFTNIKYPPTIYYNDSFNSFAAQRFTIFHELKHFVFEDNNDDDDDLAEFFGVNHFSYGI